MCPFKQLSELVVKCDIGINLWGSFAAPFSWCWWNCDVRFQGSVEKWQSSAGLQKEMGLFVTEKLTEEGEASESLIFLHFTFQMYAFFTCYLQA